jgi:hypothetical protein
LTKRRKKDLLPIQLRVGTVQMERKQAENLAAMSRSYGQENVHLAGCHRAGAPYTITFQKVLCDSDENDDLETNARYDHE